MCLGVDQHRAEAGENRYDGGMNERDRRKDKAVGRAEKVGELLLDVYVEPWIAEQPRPARMGAPSPELALD